VLLFDWVVLTQVNTRFKGKKFLGLLAVSCFLKIFDHSKKLITQKQITPSDTSQLRISVYFLKDFEDLKTGVKK
jgi:hypothetical protein